MRCTISYRHIYNLYKNKDILYFKRCIASEKIHGTSAHIKYKASTDALTFFSGGSEHETFVNIFDQEALLKEFRENARNHADIDSITIYGEAYGAGLGRFSRVRYSL